MEGKTHMFYAIEYAYGRNVQNNGARANQIMTFTASKLRAAWIGDGTVPNGAGSRDALIAADPRIKGQWLEDGDKDAWQIIAAARVAASPGLNAHKDVIFHDWGDSGHPEWVATASQREIIGWAKAVSDD